MLFEYLHLLPFVSLPNIPFSTDAFFVLIRAKSPIAQKASVEKGIFDSRSRGTVKNLVIANIIVFQEPHLT